ncbi:zinc finger protein chinmo isoform X3 [Vanessa atalanta]|uniref:zinc finger protein chinmo isoform X3 n=1 Tax=Vanessa cardui TaxID=171605 RepID=UPI000E77B6CE|nr:zinc finger protein chinmo isoform X3 [Vanessa tameamea]XP_046961366.1 zinc finger protein chinmo isoform X3 [Vanessa cardui]XP_047544861.1 zinc finger protein chinmo isoform X3 [Vanessa atalanta]
MESRAGIRGGPGMDSQQQQYCLKWNSFGSNLATSFANLWNSESLADVTLYCEGRQFKAHKVILAACSKHFQELFDTAPPSHAGACYVFLEATTADNMQALLEFMYKGEVHVSQDALSSFLKSGENLQVKGLSMEMSNDAWVKQQTQQATERHQTRVKTSPVSGSGNCEVQDSAPPQTHTATFAPIMPQYGMPLHSGSGSMGRYAPPAHLPIHSTSHRRPPPPKPSPSQSPHARNYSVADEPDTRSSPGAGTRYEETQPDCTSTHANPIKNNGYERAASTNEEMMERLPNDQGAEDLRVKSENDYHASGYNNSPPPAVPIPTTNYHDKPHETSPVPPKPSPDTWPTKLITSKSGGIATADGKKLKCPYCERLYGYETNLRAHIRQRHQGIRVPCPHCSRTFTRNNTVRRHIAREHRHQVTPHLSQGPLPNHTQ